MISPILAERSTRSKRNRLSLVPLFVSFGLAQSHKVLEDQVHWSLRNQINDMFGIYYVLFRCWLLWDGHQSPFPIFFVQPRIH